MGKKMKTIGKSVLKYPKLKLRPPTETELEKDELVRRREEEKVKRMEEKIESEEERLPKEAVPAELPHEPKLGEAVWDREKDETVEETVESKETKHKPKKKILFPLEEA